MWLSLLKFLPMLGKVIPFLRGNGKAVVGSIIAVAILGTGWYISGLKDDLSDSERLREKLAGFLVECQDANASNLQTARDLERAVIRLRRAVAISDEEARQVASEAARREAEAAARLESTLTELGELRNAEPSCAAIADLDVGSACPAAVERLRERARSAANRQD